MHQTVLSCRSLRLSESSAEVIHVAGPHLQSLSYISLVPEGNQDAVIRHIATLTSLTSLHLEQVSTSDTISIEYTKLQKMRLQELTLCYCYRMAEALIVPGALLTLRKLHLEEILGHLSSFAGAMEAPNNKYLLEDAHQIAESLLSLPDLVELSGISKLFMLKLLEGWKKWQLVSGHDIRFCGIRAEVWRKVL